MTLTEKQFEAALSQMRQMAKDDEATFTAHTTKLQLEGLTSTWTCRFDDAKLFNEFGFATGSQHHSLLLCNN